MKILSDNLLYDLLHSPFVNDEMGPIIGEIHMRCLDENKDVFRLD